MMTVDLIGILKRATMTGEGETNVTFTIPASHLTQVAALCLEGREQALELRIGTSRKHETEANT